MRFLTLQRPSSEMSFNEFKTELVARAREFVNGVGKCRELIAEYCQEFILNDSVSPKFMPLVTFSQIDKLEEVEFRSFSFIPIRE